jgi:hypothetical protein
MFEATTKAIIVALGTMMAMNIKEVMMTANMTMTIEIEVEIGSRLCSVFCCRFHFLSAQFRLGSILNNVLSFTK